ncbi:hypothetical protein QTH97_33100 [Variovorax sp. J22R24]|uniref:hypothetical protein n=1 Tax=Variovorax gracilis TaxID=3053502 RepID=UPI002577BB86|nr:hypothetical protein [Variovorax sp. J22R24]MDM0109795.1 hypothetical protein [Variovorax sp. J22R24]
MDKTLRVLIEIRLRRSDKVQDALTDERHGLWIPDIPSNRAKLAQAAEVANQRHGHETHWIEERQA